MLIKLQRSFTLTVLFCGKNDGLGYLNGDVEYDDEGLELKILEEGFPNTSTNIWGSKPMEQIIHRTPL
jgi:hypothetical protein